MKSNAWLNQLAALQGYGKSEEPAMNPENWGVISKDSPKLAYRGLASDEPTESEKSAAMDAFEAAGIGTPSDESMMQAQALAYLQQQRGVNEQADLLKQFKQKPKEINLAPALNTVDFLAGTQLAKGYERPMSEEERQVTLMKLQDAVQGQRGKVTSELGELLKAKMMSHSSRENGIKERFNENKINKALAAHQKNVGDMLPSIQTKLQNINSLISKYGDNLPGVGPGQSLIPDMALSDEASQVQQNARGLMADLIKLQSGTAASDKEVDRKLKERGMAWDSKPSTFISGMGLLQKEIKSVLKNKETVPTKIGAGGISAFDLYREAGGLTSEDIGGLLLPEKQSEEIMIGKGGVKYKLTPGADRKKKESWKEIK